MPVIIYIHTIHSHAVMSPKTILPPFDDYYNTYLQKCKITSTGFFATCMLLEICNTSGLQRVCLNVNVVCNFVTE